MVLKTTGRVLFAQILALSSKNYENTHAEETDKMTRAPPQFWAAQVEGYDFHIDEGRSGASQMDEIGVPPWIVRQLCFSIQLPWSSQNLQQHHHSYHISSQHYQLSRKYVASWTSMWYCWRATEIERPATLLRQRFTDVCGNEHGEGPAGG